MERDISATSSQPVYQLAPEQIAGPYFRNPKLLRRNISEGAEGLPLLLRLTIVDAMTGEPVSGALVDIWHCNALGACSGGRRINPDLEAGAQVIGSNPRTDDDTSLRGRQFCDQHGRVRFTTVYPGFYAGRALHVHVAVRIVGGNDYLDERNVAWVGQLYFPERVSRAVLNARDCRGRAFTALNSSEVCRYSSLDGEGSTLTVWPIGRDSHEDGFFGHLTIGIDTFAASSQIKPEDFDKYTV
ncbi:intradiol ring-cleavage dioxygenase [Pseudomonas sp. HMWF021]|uniref:intradiol ring-cleavage dioxygenase n=1 Tax=Pseudomonas sp. HMWF021 TaxID=2056857 RepID=UPI000D388AE7|nr:intradiol ring-cleavage dioxygenase [Pseudomonas sp. HMWF021]PTT32896.1 intradiol ring-cleavage dioxygenase [Pseudomonas sp. HMWF021]